MSLTGRWGRPGRGTVGDDEGDGTRRGEERRVARPRKRPSSANDPDCHRIPCSPRGCPSRRLLRIPCAHTAPQFAASMNACPSPLTGVAGSSIGRLNLGAPPCTSPIDVNPKCDLAESLAALALRVEVHAAVLAGSDDDFGAIGSADGDNSGSGCHGATAQALHRQRTPGPASALRTGLQQKRASPLAS